MPSFLLTIAALLCIAGAATPQAHAEGPAPVVAITSPIAGSTVKGTVTITAKATATGASDHPTSITFYDGANEIGFVSCGNSGQRECTVSESWRATGDTGTHTLTATADTNENSSATSEPVMVTVLSPPPTVAITSPANGSTVKGNVTITVSGTSDPSQEEYPTSILVYDGVNEISSIRCQGQQTCEGSVVWHATGLSGQHVLTAKIQTNRNLSATSAPASVRVESPPPTVRITSPASGRPLSGISAIAVSGATDPSQVDYPTSIEVYDGTDEIGSVDCQGQPTCAGSVKWSTHGLTGKHVLKATIHTDTSRTATSASVTVGGTPTKPHSRPACRMTTYAVALRKIDRGICTVGGVPKGTHIAIEAMTPGGTWVTAVRGRVSRRGTFHFFLKVVKRSTFRLAVTVSATRRYKLTTVAFGTLQVG
jgi:hypothetical protein